MINRALRQMASDDEELYDVEDPIEDDTDVDGSCFHIRVKQDTDNPRWKEVSKSLIPLF
jgi:hypothetical protein